MTDIVERLREWGTSGDHASTIIREAANEILSLRQQLGAKQAQIDALMLEFCPDEMTQDQLDEWARNQRKVSEVYAIASEKENGK